MTYFGAFSALILAAIFSGLSIPLLRRMNAVDIPNFRSSHTVVIARGGGAGVLVAFFLSLLIATPEMSISLGAILFLIITMAVLGFMDDLGDISAIQRLSFQICSSLLASMVLVQQGSSQPLMIRIFLVALFTFGITAFVNAFNFMDGINGISIVTAVIAGCYYYLETGRPIGLLMAFAVLGFLPWNLTNRLFLGDIGAYSIGTLISALACWALISGSSWTEAGAPLMIYLADTSWAFVRKRRNGLSWSDPHREHVYQRLVDNGHSHLSVALTCGMFQILCCIIGSSLQSTIIAFLLMALTCLVYLSLPSAELRNVGRV